MKKIEVIIEPSNIEEMKEDLAGIGVGPMIVTEVHGFGRPGGRTEVFRGVRFEPPYVTEAKIEVVVRDEMVEGAIRIIREKAKTDEPEDRDIRVFSLEDIAGQARGKTGAVAS